MIVAGCGSMLFSCRIGDLSMADDRRGGLPRLQKFEVGKSGVKILIWYCSTRLSSVDAAFHVNMSWFSQAQLFSQFSGFRNLDSCAACLKAMSITVETCCTGWMWSISAGRIANHSELRLRWSIQEINGSACGRKIPELLGCCKEQSLVAVEGGR